MCGNCFETSIYQFNTYLDFEEFEELLRWKILHGQLIASRDKHFMHSNETFKCSVCHEEWLLSIPDNAWRGYFLPIDKATKFESDIKKQDKERSLGCMIILILAIVIIITAIIKL